MSWHRRPSTDDWKRVTLASIAALGQKVWLRCNECGHERVEVPAELALRAKIGTDTPLLIIGEALRCSECGAKKGHAWPHGVAQ